MQGIHLHFETRGRHTPKVQNWSISGPTKSTYVIQKFENKTIQKQESPPA